MACYHPLLAWRTRTKTAEGTRPITFDTNKADLTEEVVLPCGKCIGCRLERSRQWATRAIFEASLHENNCFVTLTFNEENRPPENSLDKRTMQLFMKKLRKRYSNETIRYFLCGEYGELNDRPHYHVCLFNHDFPDKTSFAASKDFILYRSQQLEKLWPYGFSTIGSLTFESAAYVARYVCKKITGPMAQSHYGKRTPEFCLASRNPGLGAGWFQEFKGDVLSTDRVIIRNNLKVRPPKYYDYIVQRDAPDLMDQIKLKRKESIDPTKSTARRLQDKETIQNLRFKKLQRSLENGTTEDLLNP